MDDDVSEYVDSTAEILQAANSGGQRGLNEQATSSKSRFERTGDSRYQSDTTIAIPLPDVFGES